MQGRGGRTGRPESLSSKKKTTPVKALQAWESFLGLSQLNSLGRIGTRTCVFEPIGDRQAIRRRILVSLVGSFNPSKPLQSRGLRYGCPGWDRTNE